MCTSNNWFFTNSWRIKIASESNFDEHGKEVRERTWMSLVVQSTLVKTCPAKLIATILKALREQLKETDQLNAVEETAGPVPEINLEYDQILKEKGTMSMENICQKISCLLPDVKRLRGYILKVNTNLSQCKNVKFASTKLLDLIWVGTDRSVDPRNPSWRISARRSRFGLQT